jgi:triosephosphate isomerase
MFNNKRPYITIKPDYSKPFVVLNFKTYNESVGQNALRLAMIAENVQKITGLNIFVCIQAIDLKDATSHVKIPVLAQYADHAIVGKSTGSIVPEHLSNINVKGSLLNHSEYRIALKDIEKTIMRLKELDMISIVCAKDQSEAKKISKFKYIKPTFIAIEPPELIGGELSVSKSEPDVIAKSVNACGDVPVLIGAGIKDNDDMKIALQNGAKGVLLSSHFVLAKDPEKFLIELLKDIK